MCACERGCKASRGSGAWVLRDLTSSSVLRGVRVVLQRLHVDVDALQLQDAPKPATSVAAGAICAAPPSVEKKES